MFRLFEQTLWQLQDSERQVDELLHRTVELETEKVELTARLTVARAHIGWLSDQLAAERAENEALRLEIWKRPQPSAQVLQPLRIPTEEQLEAGQW